MRRYKGMTRARLWMAVIICSMFLAGGICGTKLVSALKLKLHPYYVVSAVTDQTGLYAPSVKQQPGVGERVANICDVLFGGNFYRPAMAMASASGVYKTVMTREVVMAAEKSYRSGETLVEQPSQELPPINTNPLEKTISASGGNIKVSDKVTINNETTYPVDAAAMLSSEKPFALAEKPEVLIVHTHATESYAQSEQYRFPYTSTDRTTDTGYNVVRIGEEIAGSLEAAGIGVVHDKSLHDYPEYNDSYARAYQTIAARMKENPSIRIVLDIHRDAIINNQGERTKLVTEIDGQKVAQVMLVVGTDQLGLKHDHWQTNLKFASMLQQQFLAISPTFARPINLRTSRFNGHAAPGAVIIEVGSSGNTLDETLGSAQYIAKAVAATIEMLR